MTRRIYQIDKELAALGVGRGCYVFGEMVVYGDTGRFDCYSFVLFIIYILEERRNEL